MSILDLYKFLIGREKHRVAPLVPEDDRAALVPYNAHNDTSDLRASPNDENLVDVKTFLCKQLKEIWELPPELKGKAVRRLYLKWHPDKNLDDPARAEKVFLFLKKQIDHLDNEEPLDDPTEVTEMMAETDDETSYQSRASHKRQADYNYWDNTATRHHEASTNERC